MLNTQVEYWKNVETARHNREQEAAAYLQAKASLSQAESAAKTAQIKDFEAGTNWWKANRDYEVALGNLGVAGRNAASNAAQAQAALQNAGNKQREVDLAYEKLPYDIYVLSGQGAENYAKADEATQNATNTATKNEYADEYYNLQNEQQRTGVVKTKVGIVTDVIDSVGSALSGSGKFMSGLSNVHHEFRTVPH